MRAAITNIFALHRQTVSIEIIIVSSRRKPVVVWIGPHMGVGACSCIGKQGKLRTIGLDGIDTETRDQEL